MQGIRAHGLAAAVFAVAGTLAPAAQATPGDLDPSFSSDGIVRIGLPEGSQWGTAVAPAPDGGVVAGGTRVIGGDFAPDERSGIVVRLRADGSVDPAFGDGGTAVIHVDPGFQLTDVAVQADGAIVAAGYAQGGRSFGPFPGVIARMTPGGELDPAFAGDGIATFELPAFTGVEIDALGRVVAAGASVYSAQLTSTTGVAVLRLLPDGSPDPSYSEDGFALGEVGTPLHRPLREDAPKVGLALDQQGRAVVGASSSHFRVGNTLFRFTADGSPDEAFGDEGRVDLPGTSAETSPIPAVAPDGRLLAALEEASNLEPTANGVLELGADGELDAQRAVRLGDVNAHDMVVADSGVALLAGSRLDARGEDWDFGIAAVAPGPALDGGFGDGGLARVRLDAADDVADAIALDSGGRVLVAGRLDRFVDVSELVVARVETGPGPPDKDGDGLLDANDRCPLRFGPGGKDGCPTARRRIRLRVHSISSEDGRRTVRVQGTITARSNTFWARAGRVRLMRSRPGRDKRVGTMERQVDISPPIGPTIYVDEYELNAVIQWPVRGVYARVERSFSGEDGACAPERAKLRLP